MKQALIRIAKVLLLLGAGIALLSLWIARPPRRPKNLPQNALFIPDTPRPFQFGPSGVWLVCWKMGTTNRCMVTTQEGEPDYQGDFLPLAGGPISGDQLRPVFTRDAGYIWIWSKAQERMVPIVCLANGAVLLPAESFDELKGKLDRGIYKSPCP
jgi:hypothetical protein